MDDLIAGRYALGALLGSGGMARVYAADDQRLHRRVALKLVPIADAEPIARQRFVREARSAAGFTHPNAVAIYDAGEADGYLYLVMELIDGRSLHDRLADGPLDSQEATGIASGVLRALAAAHAVGIVHRDVKPANILLGRDGVAKLADFGIAKRLDDAAGDVTIAGEIVGTPKYLAPELVGGSPATPSSDVYAAGAVLYEMLAGHPPYDAGTPLATALAHVNEPTPELRALRPDVPAGLAQVVRRAMAKRPSERFESAGSMLDALAATAAEPSAAAPHSDLRPEPTQVMPPGGYSRRSWSPLWLAVVAALLVGGGVAAYFVVRDDDPQRAATGSTAPAPTEPTATTSAPTTLVTTTIAPTTPSTAVPNEPDVGTIDGIIATLAANPTGFGPKTEEVIKELGKINDNGNGNGNAARRAAELLDKAAEWVENDELEPAVLQMLEPVLGPLASQANDDEGDDD